MLERGAIITGAASGMGLAVAKDLLAKGWRVVMADINPAGEELAASFGENALFVQTDTSSWDGQMNVFRKAFEWTTPTFLFANAGVTGTDPTFFGSISTASSDPPQKPTLQTVNVNLLGTIYSIQLFTHFFLARKTPTTEKGSIVVTASEGGVYNLSLDPIYCATKYALVGLVRSLGPTLVQSNVTINAILPGFVPSAMTSPILPITPVEYRTPLTTIVDAVTQLMEGEQTGQTLECSGTELFYQKQQAYPNEIARWVWEDAPKVWQAAWEKSQQA
ncbi:hypothetical protein MMC11_007084 [Xylographa trunciseda]|nr:hypothetical protein [Xylographa trunciseda]